MSALTLVKLSYFVAATLFLLGLQRMASPRTARSGIQWAGAGMLVATLVALQTASTGYDMRQVLVFDIPLPRPGPYAFEITLDGELAGRVGLTAAYAQAQGV